MDDEKFTALVRNAAAELIATPAMEKLVKECVLLTLNEMNQRRYQEIAETFLRHCDAAGVKVRLDDKGRIMVAGADKLDPAIRAVLTLHRAAIVEELLRRNLQPATLPFKGKKTVG